MRKIKKLHRDEKGYVLILALALLFIGGVLIVPLLNFMNTGLKSGQIFENETDEVYAADAGVEDAIWQIMHQDDPVYPSTIVDNTTEPGFTMTGIPPYDHDNNPATPMISHCTYSIAPVNGKNISITIQYLDSDHYQVFSTATSPEGKSTEIKTIVSLLPGSNLDIFDGALVSLNNISLKKDCSVTGDIIYGGSFNYGSGFYHDGDEFVEQPQFPTQEQNEQFANAIKAEAMAGGTYHGSYYISAGNGVTPKHLGPLYIQGNLNIAKDNIIILDGPIYVEGNIDVDKEGTFSGNGSIIATGNIYLQKVANYGTNGTSIIMSLNGNVVFKKEATLEALIYAPNGTIQFDKAANVTGSIVGQNIQSDKDFGIVYNGEANDLELPGYIPGTEQVLTWIIT